MNKNKKIISFIALALMVFMLLPFILSCASKYDTVVVASTQLTGVFSPMFAETGYDVEVTDYTQVSIYKYDRYANFEPFACEYAKPVEYEENGKTYVKYTFKLKKGIKFSDGEPMTADDIIFTYKLYFDPTYDGLSTLYTLPVVGAQEYRFDDPNYAATAESLHKKAETDLTDEWVAQWITDVYGAAYGFTYEDAWNDKYYEDPDDRADALEAYYARLVADYVSKKLTGGTAEVAEISGITKVDEFTVEVIVEGASPIAEHQLAILQIVPEHYYGEGYVKGDLSAVKALSGKPMGAGPYKFISFENNIVTLEANEDYFLGKPKTPVIKYQWIDEQNKIEVVKLGNADISDPSAKPENVKEIEDAGLHYELVENLGYGYVGISADLFPDKNVRKGIMHMMDRIPAVETYYGNLASVIERPISKVSWAYPQNAKEYYGYDLDKALDYFKSAGYTQENGVLAKNGEQLYIELWVGDSEGDHPVMPMYTQMKIDFEKLGARCEIMAVEWDIMQERYTQGKCMIWAAAWSASVDPDMYQTYHSSQIATNNNPYRLNNSELDKIIEEARVIIDQDKRKELYAQALDIIMEEAVEMPYYQRKNLFLIHPDVVNVKTLPDNMTPYYGWNAEIEKMQLK